MIITVYCVKGSAGKTPIATNFVLDRGFALGTNEIVHVFDQFDQKIIPDNRLICVQPDEDFPKIPEEVDIVFDLAGSISRSSTSISSALQQSDVVIIPIYNEIKCLVAGIHTILEVANFTKNIVVVATKLQKQKGETFKNNNWEESSDFLNVKNAITNKVDFDLEILPLKFSKAFDSIFEREMSISQMMESDPLLKYSYRDVAKQFNKIYEVVGQYA